MPVIKFEKAKQISAMLDVNIIEYGLFCGNDWNYKDLRAPYTRLYIIFEGDAVVRLDHESIRLTQGNAYIIPSNTNFSCYTPKHLKKLYVHFSCKQWAYNNLFDQVQTVQKLPVDVPVYEAFVPILESETLYDHWNVKGSILHLIYQFIGNIDSKILDQLNCPKDPEVMVLLAMLNQGVTAKTRTSDLAEKMKMSQSMLSKLYKSATGGSLKDHIQLRLIEQAQTLLISTNKSIKEIAADLHYDDALYFSRVFHQWVGESPTKYRERNRMGET